MAEQRRRTTGIGSLPHSDVDAAIAAAFRTDIPYLPELPARGPGELMLARARAGLGVASPAETACAWAPFLEECARRRVSAAKVQLAGPVTLLASLTQPSPATPAHAPGTAQILPHVERRARTLLRALGARGVRPLLFLDEPALSSPSARSAIDPRDLAALVGRLRAEGAELGVHCCGQADWNAVLSLGADYVSFDADLSLEAVLASPGLRAFAEAGGRLAIGAVPTSGPPASPAEVWRRLRNRFAIAARNELGAELAARLLATALLTPACGFALRSVGETEAAFTRLNELGALAEEAAAA